MQINAHLSRNNRKLHPIDRPAVLEEEQVRLVGLVREHPDAHVLGEDRRAHERHGGAAGAVEVRPVHAVDLEERRPEAVGLGDVLGRVDVLDPCGVRDAVEVEGERDFREGHPGTGGAHQESGEARGAGDEQKAKQKKGCDVEVHFGCVWERKKMGRFFFITSWAGKT